MLKNTTNNEIKAAAILNNIKSLLDSGSTAKDAYNRVLGKGAYENLASDLWEEFNT